jgi:hypothetical protein
VAEHEEVPALGQRPLVLELKVERSIRCTLIYNFLQIQFSDFGLQLKGSFSNLSINNPGISTSVAVVNADEGLVTLVTMLLFKNNI